MEAIELPLNSTWDFLIKKNNTLWTSEGFTKHGQLSKIHDLMYLYNVFEKADTSKFPKDGIFITRDGILPNERSIPGGIFVKIKPKWEKRMDIFNLVLLLCCGETITENSEDILIIQFRYDSKINCWVRLWVKKQKNEEELISSITSKIPKKNLQCSIDIKKIPKYNQ